VNQAREEVYQIRASLGLAPQPEKGKDLTDVPRDLDQTFSAVRAALADLLQTLAQLGLPLGSTNLTPREAIEEFRRLDKAGDIDRILRGLIPKVPAVLQAKAQLAQARHDLEQAELNLRYCDVVSEIDGVVTRRNVNPGNNVQVGQSLMAVRSLTEIWIDANFKETQLAGLRIGQRVKVEVDMYGNRKEFQGRITGFTMGTGQTLALLPPQNATGNFVKIVQRLPVRIELTSYDPDRVPLFVGLSVTPYVYYQEPPTGPNAGHVLQPFAPLPQGPTEPKP
jgi:membrane fusion protein (multidrug efflux system)